MKLVAPCAAQWALLVLYFAAAKTDVNLGKWLESFSWAPASRPFALDAFARAAGEAVWAAAVFSGWLGLAWAAGRALLRRAGLALDDPGERLLVSTGLGLGALSLGGFALAGLGWLHRPGVLGLAALLALWSRPSLAPASAPKLPRGPLAAAAILAAATLAFHLAGALLPPTSFDELTYQLTLPKLYALHEGFVSMKFNHLSFLPRNMGMLYALGLLTGGAAAAKLFYWGMGVLAASALLVYGRRWWGSAAGLWASVVFVMTPVIGNQFRNAAADLGVGFYELMGLFLLLRWGEDRRLSLLALSGTFWGLALGTKYTAIPGFSVGAAILGYFLFKTRSGPKDGAQAIAAFAGPALALWLPWLVRNWIDCGNPVAPLLSTLIPSRNFIFAGRLEPLVDYAAGGLGIPHYFTDLSARDWLLLPWTLSVRYNDYSHDLGALFLLCLPLAAFVPRRPSSRQDRLLAAACLLYWALWLVIGVRMTRYFAAGIALTSLLAGVLLARAAQARSSLSSWALLAPVLAALIQQSLRTIQIQNEVKKPWGYASGRTSLAEYVSAAQPDMPMAAFDYANRELPRRAKVLLIGEFRAFYLDRDFLASTPWDHDYWHEYLRLSSGSDDLSARLKADGITHLLVNDDYVPRKTGRRRVRPEAWTPEDEAKSALFLEKRARELFRGGGSWVAVFR